MPHSLEFDVEQVFPFVHGLVPSLARATDMVGIGLRRNGVLIAGAIFERHSGPNIWAHVAGEPGARWLVRGYLQACLFYAFVTCGVQRISGYVDASNHPACRANEHLGLVPEARLTGAAPDGGDVIIYVLWRKDCRHVDSYKI